MAHYPGSGLSVLQGSHNLLKLAYFWFFVILLKWPLKIYSPNSLLPGEEIDTNFVISFIIKM